MEDHYFGAIKDSVIQFMEDFDHELYRRGIPSKTRHNEVAPNQFEVAPLYEEENLSIDHNLQLMDILKKVADEHGMLAVPYEKPLAGVNGSGKHFNFSIGDDTGANYFDPSGSPQENIMFLLSLGALLLGVDKFGGLLRGAVADAGNDHRLGANEAPPAIISVYLGDYLDALMNEIEGLKTVNEKHMSHIYLGVQNLPRVAKDTSDRNRTSPMAFTGNKFEFRAVGGSQNCSDAATMVNLVMTYGYDEITRMLEAKKSKSHAKEAAIEVLKEVLKKTKRVRFEGNGYDEAWHKEAAKRGLPNTKTTPDALEQFLDKDVVALFSKYNVLNEKELHSKIDIKLENYIKTKDIEFKMAVNIVNTMILPAINKQITATASAVSGLKEAGIKTPAAVADLKELNSLYGKIKDAAANMEKVNEELSKNHDLLKHAKGMATKGAAALADLRAVVDATEKLVSDEYWPMAKYQELLTVL